MTIEELYNAHENCWARLCREVNVSPNTYQNWLKLGYIPISTQIHIEKATKGQFKADLKHTERQEWTKN